MLGHLSFGVNDLAKSTEFYDRILVPLGYVRVWTSAKGVGYGTPGGGDKLALFPHPGRASPPGAGFHLAFTAPNQAAVDGFHAAAMAQGGKDLGAPGLRPHYGPAYYAAFVCDPDGYKLEAVHQ